MKYVKSLGFQSDPKYEYLTGLFIDILETNFNTNPNEKFVYDWDEKYKLSMNIEPSQVHNTKKINTSIAIGVSKQSPYFNRDDSNLAQMKNDINNNSIFLKPNM